MLRRKKSKTKQSDLRMQRELIDISARAHAEEILRKNVRQFTRLKKHNNNNLLYGKFPFENLDYRAVCFIFFLVHL